LRGGLPVSLLSSIEQHELYYFVRVFLQCRPAICSILFGYALLATALSQESPEAAAGLTSLDLS
jgi:hypothetical protein